MSKTVLVTGASSGVGLETALQLARSGFSVVASVRRMDETERLRELAQREGLAIELQHLDVEDAGSIEKTVAATLAKHGRIDVLVNNAGAGYVGGLEQTPPDALARVFNVNFFGVWRVTSAVLPHMRAARSGRIITVSSIGGLLGQPFNDAYSAAKFATEGLMESLAPVVRHFGIKVSVIEPGAINTGFAAQAGASIERAKALAGDDYRPLLESYLRATEGAYAKIGQTGADVARIITEAATADEPHFRYPTSALVTGLISKKYVDPSGDSIVPLIGARLPPLPAK
jgi:NAD(P)-dependent dehydrogenase (short-subunit alcohol dehydrogenase family)